MQNMVEISKSTWILNFSVIFRDVFVCLCNNTKIQIVKIQIDHIQKVNKFQIDATFFCCELFASCTSVVSDHHNFQDHFEVFLILSNPVCWFGFVQFFTPWLYLDGIIKVQIWTVSQESVSQLNTECEISLSTYPKLDELLNHKFL